MAIVPGTFRISSVILNTEGKLSKGTANYAYIARDATPWRILYTGAGDDGSGDEIYAPYRDGENTLLYAIGWLQVFKPDDTKFTLNESMFVVNILDLHSGGLEVAAGTQLRLGRRTYIEYGSGDIVSGEGEITVAVGPLATYNPQLHGLNLAYFGDEDRGAGFLWQRSQSAPGVPLTSTVNIDGVQHCGKASPTIQLGSGFSRIDGHLNIGQGALDLAGQHLVAYASRSNLSQRIIVGANGAICDSSVGLPCGGGAPTNEAILRERPVVAQAPIQAGVKPEAYEEAKSSNDIDRETWLTSASAADDELVSMTGAHVVAESRKADGAHDPTVESGLVEAIEQGVRLLRYGGAAGAIAAVGEQIAQLRAARKSASKAAQTGGMVHFAGNGDTEVHVATQAQTKSMASFIIKRDVKHENSALNRTGTVNPAWLRSGPGLRGQCHAQPGWPELVQPDGRAWYAQCRQQPRRAGCNDRSRSVRWHLVAAC